MPGRGTCTSQGRADCPSPDFLCSKTSPLQSPSGPSGALCPGTAQGGAESSGQVPPCVRTLPGAPPGCLQVSPQPGAPPRRPHPPACASRSLSLLLLAHPFIRCLLNPVCRGLLSAQSRECDLVGCWCPRGRASGGEHLLWREGKCWVCFEASPSFFHRVPEGSVCLMKSALAPRPPPPGLSVSDEGKSDLLTCPRSLG